MITMSTIDGKEYDLSKEVEVFRGNNALLKRDDTSYDIFFSDDEWHPVSIDDTFALMAVAKCYREIVLKK